MNTMEYNVLKDDQIKKVNEEIKENKEIEEVKIVDNDFTEDGVTEEKTNSVTKQDIINHHLSIKENDPTELLSDFLSKYEITRKELIELVNQFKSGIPIPLTSSMKQKTTSSMDKAKAIAEKGEQTVRLNDVYVVDPLVKNFGYVVDHIDRSGKVKIWVCKKK
jgi:hypothetical protein